MKKTILVTILVAVMLLAAVSTVNAATVSISDKTVKEGDTVTVTVKTDKDIKSSSLNVNYDASKFEYVSASTGDLGNAMINSKLENTVRISVADPANTTKTITVTFRAKKDVASDENVEFSVTNYVNNENEELTASVVSVKVIEAEEQEKPGDNTEKPGDNTQVPDDNTQKPGDNTQKPGDNKPTDINGKPIEDHPQTGAPLYIGAVAVIVMALGTMLVVKKSK